MRKDERGYTLVELVITSGIIAMVAAAAFITIFQIFRSNERSNDYATSVRQVENAGYWITRDAQMSQTVTAGNLALPDFLIVNWTEWDMAGQPVYHSVKYFFDDMSGHVGTLKRLHWSNNGLNEQTLIARDIYYNSDNASYTSHVSYQSPVLSVRVTSILHDSLESREYQAILRANY